MKYKESPTPGELKNANIHEVSMVDKAANGKKFSIIKRSESDTMDEKQKKMLTDAGLNPESVEKAVSELPSDEKEGAKKGFFAIFKNLVSPKPEPAKEPFSIESLRKDFKDIAIEVLKEVNVNKSNPENVLAPVSKSESEQLADLEKDIEIEKKAILEQSDIKKKLEEKTKEYEDLKKRRLGSNSEPRDTLPGLSSEEIKKKESVESWGALPVFKSLGL